MPWQKPWKPGEQISAENFSTGQKYTGGNSLYLMSRGIRDGRGDNRWGTPTTRFGKRAGRFVQAWDASVARIVRPMPRNAKDEKGKTLKDKDGKTIYEEEQRSRPICKAVHGVKRGASRRVGIEAERRSSTARMGRSPGRREGDRSAGPSWKNEYRT